MGLLYANVTLESVHVADAVRAEAHAYYDKNKAFRLWGSSHGGIYVPVDDVTQPNPHLSDIPERDITTPSGRQLTLLNPSSMLREVMKGYEGFGKVLEKLTTFPDRLINELNRPDGWELDALEQLARGENKVQGIIEVEGESYYRLMHPLLVKQACLKCHDPQTYKVGAISGGISISVPMAPFLKHQSEVSSTLCASYSLIWLVGLIGIFFAIQAIKNRAIEALRLTRRLEKSNRKLEKYSYQDSLTQIANRRMFDALLKREWAAAKRNSYPLSLIMIDIDHFKVFNDGYGHQAGDICLSRIATALNAVSRRSTDLLARYGGEEFVILLPNTKESEARRIAKSCHSDIAALNIPHEFSDAADIVTISVGVTTMRPCKDDDIASLIEMADKMLYKAKNSGRNRVEFA